MAEYGIPYMGSKCSIANELIKIFPKADNFYDLFGGGFSITHALITRRSKDYKEFHFNEIRPGLCELIKSAINGEYNYTKSKPKWISREEFFEKKEIDLYIKLCWSFGNNGQRYLFSKNIEPYKKSMHNALVFNEFDALAKKVLCMEKFKDGYSINSKRLLLRNKIEYYRVAKIPDFLYPYLKEEQLEKLNKITQLRQLQQLEQLERLERLEQLGQLEQLQELQQLERLGRLERLQELQQLEFYNTSYENVHIKENSIIYCDIPYKGTEEYDKSFNHDIFFDWAANNKHPVYISEYNIEDIRFKQVFQIEKRSIFSGSKNKCIDMKEKVYINSAGLRLLIK
jgi:hypothetical protein